MREWLATDQWMFEKEFLVLNRMNKRKVAHKDVTRWGSQKALTPTHALDLMGNRTATDIKAK